MLNSAAGVTLPSSLRAPPMMTSSRARRTTSGALASATAISVYGPRAQSVMLSGAASRSASIRKSTPCRGCSGIDGSGSMSAPSPVSPCTLAAATGLRSSGRAQPAKTATSGRPASSQTRRAFFSVSANGRLPATATMPSTSNSADAASAHSRARASSVPGSVSMMILRRMPALSAAHDEQLLDLGDRLGRVQVLGAGAGAVHDRMAAVEPERVFERIKALAGLLVAAVGDPAIGLQQHRRTEIALAGPPIARAGGRAAEAQDALPQTVEPFALRDRLRPLAIGRRRAFAVEPGPDRAVLRDQVRQIGHQILDDRQVRQRTDPHRPLDVGDRLDAGKRVRPVDIHRAGAANPLAARAAKGQRRIDLVLDLDQRVENHRAAFVEIDREAVDDRVLPVIRVPAIDPEFAHPLGVRRGGDGLAGADPGIRGKGKLDHSSTSKLRAASAIFPRKEEENRAGAERGADRDRTRFLSRRARAAEKPAPRWTMCRDGPAGSRAPPFRPRRAKPAYASANSCRRARGNPRGRARRGSPCGSRPNAAPRPPAAAGFRARGPRRDRCSRSSSDR